MASVTLFAWKFRGAVNPEDGSVSPVGNPASVGELQGTTAEVAKVDVLQNGAPEGPPSP
jgi:hypothetical protein